jgi:hypothetical protein
LNFELLIVFADEYLKKNNFQPVLDNDVPDEAGIIIVIPCYIEPDILRTLDSLAMTNQPDCGVEVIVVINHSEIAPEEEKVFNFSTLDEISRWIIGHNEIYFRVLTLGPVSLQKKWAGAGLARKKGMDEAVYRFNKAGKPDGIIVSLDADTIVDANYLTEIENHFLWFPENVGSTINFSHLIEEVSGRQLEGILLYEKYLRYFKTAVEFTGYPHSMYTIGSAFCVRADAYVKRGGMSRRKAGEDFYFLQNLALLGNIGEINTTCVHPSARSSMRVPFGTGASITRWLDGREDLTMTYSLDAFIALNCLFAQKEMIYHRNQSEYESFISQLPVPVFEFLKADDFWTEISDLNRNCSTIRIFGERFFQKFNSFKIIKYLNFVHGRFYPEADLNKQVELLIELTKENKMI